jgi:hypothetical protein
MLYQLSHFRPCRPITGVIGAESQIRTGDTAIFSRVLYQLSYLGPMANQPGAVRRRTEDTTAFGGDGWRGVPLRRAVPVTPLWPRGPHL